MEGEAPSSTTVLGRLLEALTLRWNYCVSSAIWLALVCIAGLQWLISVPVSLTVRCGNNVRWIMWGAESGVVFDGVVPDTVFGRMSVCVRSMGNSVYTSALLPFGLILLRNGMLHQKAK